MSPLMHNYFADVSGIDMIYVPFKVEPGRLGEAVRGAYALNLLGVNVTVPHKQAVRDHLKEIDRAAGMIGAVNTLVRVEGGYKGYNTDAEGLFCAMAERGIGIAGRSCILVGAGGAAKAAAYILAREGAEKIWCLNRSLSSAQRLAEDINGLFGRAVMQALPLDNWAAIPQEKCLAVQATSVGMSPQADKSPVEAPAFFAKVDMAVDMVYTPMETRFMKLASQAGAKTMNGLDMLIYQGITAFELWNPGVKVPKEAVAGVRERILAFLGSRPLCG